MHTSCSLIVLPIHDIIFLQCHCPLVSHKTCDVNSTTTTYLLASLYFTVLILIWRNIYTVIFNINLIKSRVSVRSVCLKSEIHEIHEIQSLPRNPLPNQRNPLPEKRNPRNPPPTTKSTFVQPETKKRNPRNPVTGKKSTA